LVLASWQKNLAANFIAELLAIAGFQFIDPILPLYIQLKGDFTTSEAALWAGIAGSGLGIAMFFTAPLWGLLADRVGRKVMVLRAMLGGAIIMPLMGLAVNVPMIVGLRWMQGLFTGSVGAVIALSSSLVPRNRLSLAMGIIMLAVFTGQSIGPLLGGFIADHLGYTATFIASGALLLIGFFTVLIPVKEQFQKPSVENTLVLRGILKLAFSKKVIPLLIFMCLSGIGLSTAQPIISLRIKELLPGGNAATVAGLTFGITGLAAAVSSVIIGRIGIQIGLKKVLVFSSFVIGVLFLPPIWAGSVFILSIFIVLTGLFRGSLQTTSNTLVGLSVLPEQHGVVFGLTQSAGALGYGLGPLIGGSMAIATGLSPVFGLAAGVFGLTGIFAVRWIERDPTG
jgi:DHA1 family multidrug resistance protein-like MFS transporter